MDQALCRVCGSGLSPPLAMCPACATPHHADCWEYNRGCSIYGCGGADRPAITTAAEGAPEAPRGTRLAIDPRAAGLGAVLVAALAATVGTGPALLALAVMGGWAAARWQPEALEPVRETEHLADERKAVTALVGVETTEELAQAYALFEQRHPAQALEPDAQAEVALELLEGGHRTVGLTALERALQQRGLDDKRLLEKRRTVYAADPAYAIEGLGGPLGPAHGCTGFEEHLAVLRERLSPGEVGAAGAPYWLAALTPRGWPMEFQPPLRLPGHAVPPLVRASLLAGPYAAAEAQAEAKARWNAGQPALLLPASAVELPREVLEVTRVHLSRKAAMFVTARGERAFAWEDLRTIAFVWLDTVRIETEYVSESHFDSFRKGQKANVTERRTVERIRPAPLLEVHAGTPLERLRLREPHPGLFDYLGRRREASHGANIALVARDLARFARDARVSHALAYLLSGRTGAAQHFVDLPRVEEYVLWLHALGSPEARAAWGTVVGELIAG